MKGDQGVYLLGCLGAWKLEFRVVWAEIRFKKSLESLAVAT